MNLAELYRQMDNADDYVEPVETSEDDLEVINALKRIERREGSVMTNGKL